jgi:hypothetical protein
VASKGLHFGNTSHIGEEDLAHAGAFLRRAKRKGNKNVKENVKMFSMEFKIQVECAHGHWGAVI